MKTLWDRLHTWLSLNAPPLEATLRPGCSEADLLAAEEILGLPLPDDVRQSYRIHDGQQPVEGIPRPALIESLELLPLERMLAEWQRRLDWSPAWLPLLRGDEEGYFVDLGGSQEQAGKLVRWFRDGRVEAANQRFHELVRGFVEHLERGFFIYHHPTGELILFH